MCQKDICSKEIGLCAQIMQINLASVVNIFGGTCMTIYWAQKSSLWWWIKYWVQGEKYPNHTSLPWRRLQKHCARAHLRPYEAHSHLKLAKVDHFSPKIPLVAGTQHMLVRTYLTTFVTNFILALHTHSLWIGFSMKFSTLPSSSCHIMLYADLVGTWKCVLTNPTTRHTNLLILTQKKNTSHLAKIPFSIVHLQTTS